MSSTFAVHGFFIPHIKKLSGKYEITLIANPSQHPLKEFLHDYVTFVAIDVERKISLLKDIKFLVQMFLLVLRLGPCHILTMTPKVGLIMGLVGFFCRVRNRTHIFAGQVWQTKFGFSRKFLKFMDWLLIRCLTNRLADSQSQIEFLVEEGVARPGMIKTLCEGSICGVDTQLYQPNFSKYQSVRSRNGCGNNDFVLKSSSCCNDLFSLTELVIQLPSCSIPIR